MKLIDINVAKGYFLKDGGQHPTKTIWQYGAIAKELDNIPPIDAVPVVRCDNCQFWDNEHISSEGLAKCVTGESGIRYRRSYDFCSRGVRKEAESE